MTVTQAPVVQNHAHGNHVGLRQSIGFVLTKVRNATWRLQYDVGVMALYLFLHLPFRGVIYAVFSGAVLANDGHLWSCQGG